MSGSALRVYDGCLSSRLKGFICECPCHASSDGVVGVWYVSSTPSVVRAHTVASAPGSLVPRRRELCHVALF